MASKIVIRSIPTTAGKRYILGQLINGEFFSIRFPRKEFKTRKGALKSMKELQRRTL